MLAKQEMLMVFNQSQSSECGLRSSIIQEKKMAESAIYLIIPCCTYRSLTPNRPIFQYFSLSIFLHYFSFYTS